MSEAITDTMTAIEIAEPGGPEVLRPVTVPVPEPGPEEVLIRVAAAGINRPDVFQRKGLYPPPEGASPLPGLEVAGEIAALGANVTAPPVGTKVTALLAGGGYAEYAVAHAGHCLPVPEGLGMAEAASLPETFFTVWSNLFDRAHLRPDETLLVHGGTSGIGVAAIQIASALGIDVIATAGTDEKCTACRDLGAVQAINYKTQDFVAVVKAETPRGADVILDMVGGDYVARNMKAAAPDGRIVNIAFLKGSKTELDLLPVMLKRLTLTGSTLRARNAAFKAAIAEKLYAIVWPLVAEGKVRPVIDTVFPLADAAKAHDRMESSAHIGKIVLEV